MCYIHLERYIIPWFHVFLRRKIWYHLVSHCFCTVHNWKGRRTHISSWKNIAKSNSKIIVKNVDSNVVVIVILICHCILNLPELWVEFTKRKELKYAVVHRIASYLGVMSESALSFFHTLIGCDTTLTILGKSKKRFYEHLCS